MAQKAGLEPLFRSQVRTRVEGLDVLDRIEGPVIFAANHASHLDTPLILLSLPDERLPADRTADEWKPGFVAGLSSTFAPARQPRGDEMDAQWELMAVDEGYRLLPRLIRYIEEHWRLVHQAGVEDYLGEMVYYTPGSHILAALAGAWTRTTGLHALHTVLSVTVALSIGALLLVQLASEWVPALAWAGRLDLEHVGFGLVALFVLVWIASVAWFHLAHVEEKFEKGLT